MFDKNENDRINERVLYIGRPNFIFACKTIFLLFMLLGFISYLAPVILSFIAEMQVYLVSIINLPLTSYTSLILIIIYILIVIWIIWILLQWRASEYIITNFRIILKEGVLISKSHHMPFNHIQDITVSQGIISKIFSIGHVTVVNAYDLTDIEFKDIQYPEEVQELIFNEMNKDYERSYYNNPQNNYRNNDMGQFRQDSYDQRHNQFNENQFDDYQYDEKNFEDNFNREIPDDNEYDYNQRLYDKKNINQKDHDLIDNDFNQSLDESMHNIDLENIKIAKNHDDENLSVIDIYSKKFKKREK